jgi:tRNA threonylcarbamoyladenosine biosynthesis protein TsaB
LSPLHILALDTTSRAGSVAVLRDGSILHLHIGDAGLTHGQRLPGDLMRTLDRAAIRVDDLDLLAVAAGPGSFTGLRVGIAAVQGLAVARGLRVVPVPTLEALARSVASAFRPAEDSGAGLIAAWMDGQRGEVFAGLYADLPPNGGSHREQGIGGSPRDHTVAPIEPPIAAAPATVLDVWAPRLGYVIVFVGDGAIRYREEIAGRAGTTARIVEPPPLAATIAQIAFEEPHRAVEPHAIVPVYVRRPDAELARERRQGSG